MTTRASIVSSSMPTSETRTNASMTRPLSSRTSSTSASPLGPPRPPDCLATYCWATAMPPEMPVSLHDKQWSRTFSPLCQCCHDERRVTRAELILQTHAPGEWYGHRNPATSHAVHRPDDRTGRGVPLPQQGDARPHRTRGRAVLGRGAHGGLPPVTAVAPRRPWPQRPARGFGTFAEILS